MDVLEVSENPLSTAFAAFDIVVMAASMGGIEALSQVLSALPVDFPVPIVIVQHLSPTYKSHLVEILGRRTRLHVKWAESGEEIRGGVVYIAPPDKHVFIVRRGIIGLSSTPKVQFVRPSADFLFMSVAATYGKGALAVVLTGAGSDGARGAQAVKESGGTVLVQNMRTSMAFSMPSSAMRTKCVDFTLALPTIAFALTSLVMVKGATQFFMGV